jgi:hypothetical protein
MLSSSWISLLRLIPEDYQDAVVLSTSGGIEVNIQAIVRLEKDFMVFRGRLAASTDAGRVFFVPYDQVNFLTFSKPMREPEIQAMFSRAPGSGRPAAVAVARPQEEVPADTEQLTEISTPEPRPAPAPAAPAAAAEPARTPMAAKSAILDRLRARVAKPDNK